MLGFTLGIEEKILFESDEQKDVANLQAGSSTLFYS
jgi:hypothetical protein